MRPRLELAVALTLLLAILIAVALVGGRQNREPSGDWRRSTYLTGPGGARGFAESLERLGVRVVRVRQRLARLDPTEFADSGAVFAVLGPTRSLGADDGAILVSLLQAGTDLLLAGSDAEAGIRCFGWGVDLRYRTLTAAPAERPASYELRVSAVLKPATSDTIRRSHSRAASGAAEVECGAAAVTAVDSLLRTEQGEPAAIRVGLADGRQVTLVADDRLFSNAALRSTSAGPFALRLVAGRYRTVLVDEYVHGFGPSGRLDRAVLAWLGRSPWGWAGWQLAGVGLLALLASGVRFGPARRVIDRRRRSPLEHVRALATALAAARGHAVAVRLLVQGLRRRFTRGSPAAAGGPLRGDPDAWLVAVAPRLRSERGRAAAARLRTLIERPARAEDVLEAADLVEDVWSDLTAGPRPAT